MSSIKLVGTVYMKPLPGAPWAEHEQPTEILQKAGFTAVQEAHQLAQCGFDAVILQNFGDFPHYESSAPSDTIASMAIIAAAVREAVQIGIGIQILEKDVRSALSIAAVTGCDFIHVPLAIGADQIATLLRERARLHSPVGILVQPDRTSVPKEPISWADGLIVPRNQLDGISWKSSKTPLYLETESQDTLENVVESVRGSRSSWYGILLGAVLRKGNTPDGTLETKVVREWVRELKKSDRQSGRKKKNLKSRKR